MNGMKQNRCVIVSGGDFCPADDLRPGEDYVIACDRGYTYCSRLGLKPDLLISDFDSYTGPVDESVPVNAYASEKDDTDTMLAVRCAIERGCDEILLCCALGGRLDHLIANLQALIFARKHGVRASLRSTETEVTVLMDESRVFPRRAGWSLSVFAADGPCRGVGIRGAKYPLTDAEILPSFPIGVSNVWTEAEAEISVSEGCLLVVLSKLPEGDAEKS